jgi:hypothetical protein
MKLVGRLLEPTTVFVRLEKPDIEPVHKYAFRDPEGRTLWVLWLDDASKDSQPRPASPPMARGDWERLRFEPGQPLEWERERIEGRDTDWVAVTKMPVFYRQAR